MRLLLTKVKMCRALVIMRRRKRLREYVKPFALSSIVLSWAAAQNAAAVVSAAPESSSVLTSTELEANSSFSSITQLKAVDVTAAAPDAEIRRRRQLIPGEVSIVDSNTFYQRPVNNTSDALRYVPGVMANSTTGGDDEIISIRGSNLTNLNYANSGFLLYQDGLPVSSADGANHNRLINPFTASDIIVANGANALTYGASTLGGAIDYVTRTALNSDPRQAYLQSGSHGLYSGQVSTGGVRGDFDGLLTVGGRHFSGYRDHSRESRYSVYGNAGWQVTDDVALRFYGSHIYSHQQLAGYLSRDEFDANPRQADPSYVLGNHQLNVETDRAALKGTWDINDNSKLEFGLSHEYQSLNHPIVTSPFFSLLIDTHQNTTGAMARYHLRLGDHKLLAGANLARTTNAGGNYENNHGAHGMRTDDVSQRANSVTLFSLDRWEFMPRWTLVYGAQGVITDRNLLDKDLKYDSGVRHQKETYTAFNPRVGLIFGLNDNSEIYSSISHVYQAPNNFELDNISDALPRNTTLNAMRGWEYEIGTRGDGGLPADKGTWGWSLAIYYAQLQDEILAFGDPGNPDSANFDKTTHAGIEGFLNASYQLISSGEHLIEPLISATYNDFKFDGDATYHHNRLPSAPSYEIHGEVMYRNVPTGLYAGPTFDFIGSRYADMANNYRVGGYELVGLRAGIEQDLWELFIQVSNLTDEKYANAVAVQTRADSDARVLNPGAPRMFYAGLRLYY